MIWIAHQIQFLLTFGTGRVFILDSGCPPRTPFHHIHAQTHTFTSPLVQHLSNCSSESPITWQVCTFQKNLPVTSTDLPFIYLHIQCDYLPLRNCRVPVSPVRESDGGLRLLWALAPAWLSGGGALRARRADAQCCWGNRCPEGRPQRPQVIHLLLSTLI